MTPYRLINYAEELLLEFFRPEEASCARTFEHSPTQL
jgi:hypothetical protein